MSDPMRDGLPEAMHAERALLGAALLDQVNLLSIEAELQIGDFYSPLNRVIFAAMLRLSSDGRPLDTVALYEELREHVELEEAGGVAYLTTLTDGLPRGVNIGHYASLVRGAAKRRALVRTGHALTTAAMLPDSDPDALAAQYDAELLGTIADAAEASGPRAVGEGLPGLLSDLRRQSESTARTVGLPTGIGALDDATSGLRAGEYAVIGGYPGEGKTALALGIAAENARAGTPALIFSLEMRREELQGRLLAGYSTVPYWRIRTAQLRAADLAALAEAADTIAQWPLLVDDSPTLGNAELVARARLAIRRHGVRLVVADYIRLMRGDGPDLRQRINSSSDALRRLAKQENVAVVGLSQLRRPPAGDKRQPTLDDLKESGNLAEDAHLVLLVTQDRRDHQPTADATITIAKQRGGRMGPLAARFSAERMRFFDAAEAGVPV